MVPFLQERFTLLDWRLAPGLECFLGGDDLATLSTCYPFSTQRLTYRIVDVLLRGDWQVPQLLRGRWVDSIMDILGCPLLTIDDVEELSEVDCGDL